MLAVDATICHVVNLGGMAAMHTQCVDSFRLLNEDLVTEVKKGTVSMTVAKRKELRWRRRFYRSCVSIKAMFGSFNFVDALTPLNCIDMGNDLTVNFLLLEESD